MHKLTEKQNFSMSLLIVMRDITGMELLVAGYTERTGSMMKFQLIYTHQHRKGQRSRLTPRGVDGDTLRISVSTLVIAKTWTHTAGNNLS